MASPFDGYEVEARLRPAVRGYPFDLDRALSAVVALEARIPGDAFTAGILGTERVGDHGTKAGLTGREFTLCWTRGSKRGMKTGLARLVHMPRKRRSSGSR